jgi:serine/threonine protein kinase
MIPAYLIAIKQLHVGGAVSDKTELLEEAAVMAQFSHPNVVQLIGVVTLGEPVLVVLEYMEYGALKSYLEKNDVREDQLVSVCAILPDSRCPWTLAATHRAHALSFAPFLDSS